MLTRLNPNLRMRLVPASLLAQRFGPRITGFAGTLLFAGGVGLLAGSAGETPNFASDFLPGIALGGIGVGPHVGVKVRLCSFERRLRYRRGDQ